MYVLETIEVLNYFNIIQTNLQNTKYTTQNSSNNSYMYLNDLYVFEIKNLL